MSSLREQFIDFDDELASHGVPPLTAWWRHGIGEWLNVYEQGHVLELWACAGRGSAKSTALYKLATFFTLFGDFTIPPGERHFAIVLSRLVSEAAKGISIISAWLRLLGVDHAPKGDVIELDGSPRGIRVVAASVGAASGWRAFFVGKDERSKWAMGGAEELDAEEVDTSATAMTATHARAPVVTVGSAWGDFGGFYDAITSGTDTTKVVLGPAATWEAAPHILEVDLRRRERDPRRFAREYESKFQRGALSAFDPDYVARAFQAEPNGYRQCTKVMLIDPTAGMADTYAYAAVGWRLSPDGGPSKLVFEGVDGIDCAVRRGITSTGIVAEIASRARHFGCSVVHSDQFEKFSLQSAFNMAGLKFFSHAWTAPMKERAVERVRAWFRDDVLVFPEHERMKRELLAFEEKIAPSGALTFKGRGPHDDFAMLALLAAAVDIEGGLAGSPLFEPARKAREAADVKLYAGLALSGGPMFAPYAKEALNLPPGMTPEKERLVLERMAGGDHDPYESLWSRVARAQQRDRDAAQEAARAAEKKE
jgi:hypothetical protein